MVCFLETDLENKPLGKQNTNKSNFNTCIPQYNPCNSSFQVSNVDLKVKLPWKFFLNTQANGFSLSWKIISFLILINDFILTYIEEILRMCCFKAKEI